MATIIEFQASPDAASTYNIYDSGSVGVISPIPVMTAPAGTGMIVVSLPKISADFTGTRYVFARAVLAGIESGNSVAVAIPYVNGVVLALAPNPPSFVSLATSGRSLSVSFSLDTLNQPVVPAKVQLFVSTTPFFDYTSELAHLSFGSIATRFATGVVTGTVPGNGLYYFSIVATSAGGIQSAPWSSAGAIRLTTALPPDPVYTARGGV